MTKEPLSVKVACYSGYRGEETPKSIWLDSRKVDVIKVLDRWLSPDHRYFKILGNDDAIYIIREDTQSHEWIMTFFKQIDHPGIFIKDT